ncbi:hypothetical protein QYF61_014422 [Mycteria americana]|uniref:Uncharacterized protein n=1 Tax=Mycteria americana TaxID=33587 RepID=A0AAN7PTB4_MYCAM|nr:hypothetical protein QYF61_014422 [Mycteria americana]
MHPRQPRHKVQVSLLKFSPWLPRFDLPQWRVQRATERVKAERNLILCLRLSRKAAATCYVRKEAKQSQLPQPLLNQLRLFIVGQGTVCNEALNHLCIYHQAFSCPSRRVQLYDNMIKFMDKITGYLETEEHKDDGLLFALHTSFSYNIPLSKEVIGKAEKLFQDVIPFQGKFKHLRGKRFNEFASYIKEWLEKSLPKPPMENRQFLENIDVWHELFLFEILCVQWTQKWQSLIYSMVERWLEKSTYLALKDFSITLGTVQSYFEKQLANESQLTKEFKIMEMSEGKGNGKAAWIDAAVEKIKNYLTLSTVVNTAKMTDELRNTLELNGNFQILSDLTKYEPEFRNKRLDYMTQDLMKVKNSLSNLPEEMLDFLRELLECTRKGFVSWIKTIIKDKMEIPVFGELASTSAGENDTDIDKAALEDCVSVLLLKDTTEEASQTDKKAKEYSLAQLTEFQNKVMLITRKAEQGREEADCFLEILEKVQMDGKLYLQLLSVGNILIIDWKADIYCNPQHRVKVHTEFGIAGILVQSTRPVLVELDGLCKAMEHCLVEWKKYLETQRDTYYHLNLFTAHQLCYLCSKLAKAHNSKSRKFKNKNTDVDQATFSTLAEDELATSFEFAIHCDKVNLVWDAYCRKFTDLVSDKYISMDVFSETLKQLAALEIPRIKRTLPVGLEARKPSLIMCKEEEMLLYMVSVYRHTKTAPLPKYDEVLVCTPNTEEEEAELIVSTGLYRLLIELCILRHIQSPNGLVWKCKTSHVYLIEYLAKGKGVRRTRKQEALLWGWCAQMSSETEEKFLDLFPAVKCVSPMWVLDSLERPSSGCLSQMKEEQFDRDKLKSEAFQRSYQYLSRYKREEDLDHFLFIPERTEGTEKECLKLLLEFCGRHNPSSTELSNFTHFLNFQLNKCEKSRHTKETVEKLEKAGLGYQVQSEDTLEKLDYIPLQQLVYWLKPGHQDKKCISQEEIIIKAIQRNFGGSSDINPVELFQNCIGEVYLLPHLETRHTLRLLKEHMGKQQAGLMPRYLLLLTTNHTAFHIIQMTQLIDTENCEIIFGSGFPQDQDYSQPLRCTQPGGNYYVDLGLETHKVKSRVKGKFRLTVIKEKNIVYTQFPTPLLNHLEKHCLDTNTVLNWQQQQLKQDLQTCTRLFVSIDSSKFSNVWSTKRSPKEQDVFIGFSNNTSAAVALESTQSRFWGDLEPYEEPVLSITKRKLVQCTTPDSILHLKYSLLDDAEQIQDLYFHKQKHNSLVSTHARLLNERDLEEIRKTLNLQNKIHCLFLSQFDTKYTFHQELKYCIIDERRKSTGTGPSHVVLATQVPQVLGGCSYLAFDSGREWEGKERLCKGKKKHPGNYRPDSLTLIPGKMMQQIILETFFKHMKSIKSTLIYEWEIKSDQPDSLL